MKRQNKIENSASIKIINIFFVFSKNSNNSHKIQIKRNKLTLPLRLNILSGH